MKTTKKEVFDIVTKAYANKQAIDSVGLFKLLYFFAPSKPKEAVDAFEWAYRFIDTKEMREQLRYFYVKNNMLFAANGRVLAIVNVGNAEDGFYDMVDGSIQRVEFDKEYPFNLKYPDVDQYVKEITNAKNADRLEEFGSFGIMKEFHETGFKDKFFVRIQDKLISLKEWNLVDYLNPSISMSADKKFFLGSCKHGDFAIMVTEE